MPKLIICPDGDTGCHMCRRCSCAVPHYEGSCQSAVCEAGAECQLIDEEQRLEAEEEYKEHCGWATMYRDINSGDLYSTNWSMSTAYSPPYWETEKLKIVDTDQFNDVFLTDVTIRRLSDEEAEELNQKTWKAAGTNTIGASDGVAS